MPSTEVVSLIGEIGSGAFLEWRNPDLAKGGQISVRRDFPRLAVTWFSVTSGVVALVLVAGAGVADAATRFRSGPPAHLLESTTRVAPNGASSGLHATGPDVMASVVGLMAVLAFLFLVVTLVRGRVHSRVLAARAAA